MSYETIAYETRGPIAYVTLKATAPGRASEQTLSIRYL